MMKKILLLFFTMFTLYATPQTVTPSETVSFIPSASKKIDIQTKDTGAVLAILGISFMIIDVLVSGFTILGVGGVVFFLAGAVLFFEVDVLSESAMRSLIIAFGVVAIGFFILAVRQFLSSKSEKVLTGAEEMIGSFAKVVDVNEKQIHVLCQGEIWNATSQSELQVGQKVQVVELSGLVLKVKPIKE